MADPSSMSVSQLKAELRDTFKITDLRDCVEKGDLERKLADARKVGPPKPCPTEFFQGMDRVGNTRNPSALVVFCHGLGDTHAGWAAGMQAFTAALPHALFVLPTAPKQPVTLNGGMRMNAWYDIKTIGVGPEDNDGIIKSAEAVRALALHVCKEAQIALDRVVFAGFSQGACISIAAGLLTGSGAASGDDLHGLRCAGVAALSGYFGGREALPSKVKSGAPPPPMHLFHGESDPVVPIPLCHASKKGLETLIPGMGSVRVKTYGGLAHSAHPTELNDAAQFLCEVLP